MKRSVRTEEEKKAAQRRRSLEWYYRNRERCKKKMGEWRSQRSKAQKEKNRARNRAWYAAHREDILARRREYNAANREDILRRNRERYSPEKAREYRNRAEAKAKRKAYRARPEIRNRMKVQRHALYERNKEKVKKQVRRYRATHPEFREYLRVKSAWFNAERDQRCREDPEFYAAVRAYDRKRKALKAIKEGRVYKPNLGRRVPDYLTRAEHLRISEPARMGRAIARDAIERGVRWKA